MLNEGNQIHNFISNSDSGTLINYSSGSGSTTVTLHKTLLTWLFFKPSHYNY
jgi:hypothetical protein